MPYTYGDTAFLIEVVDRLSRNFESTSYILSQSASVIALANSELISFCQKGLHAETYTQVPYNWLTSLHAYLILYPQFIYFLFIKNDINRRTLELSLAVFLLKLMITKNIIVI